MPVTEPLSFFSDLKYFGCCDMITGDLSLQKQKPKETGVYMKKRDLIAAAVILLAALTVWGAGRLLSSERPAQLKITVGGDVYGTYPLSRDQEISIGDTNICRIEDGHVSMVWADCPDQICVHTREITSDGGTIVCLPNRIVLEITDASGQDEGNQEEIPDVVAS